MFRPHVVLVTGEFGPAEYRWRGCLSEPIHREDEILLPIGELLASSPDVRACGEKTQWNYGGVLAPILPLMTGINRGPVAGRTVTDHTATNRQPFRNVGMRVS